MRTRHIGAPGFTTSAQDGVLQEITSSSQLRDYSNELSITVVWPTDDDSNLIVHFADKGRLVHVTVDPTGAKETDAIYAVRY